MRESGEAEQLDGQVSDLAPYGLAEDAKREFLLRELNQLTVRHHAACEPYRRLIDVLHGGPGPAPRVEDVPFFPVRLFKHHELRSVPRESVVKTMTSSGTGGQAVSRIYLDRETAGLQVKVLAGIVGDFLGRQRLPMLVVDSAATVSDRLRFSARAAGILGFSMFGRDVVYALDEGMRLDRAGVEAFLRRHPDGRILVFGFTSIVWQHLVRELEVQGGTLALERGILIHGGGWKKLASEAVSNADFRARLCAVTGIAGVHNYYGMVEQTGSIFMECEYGRLHASSHSEILVRDPLDFRVLGPGETGLLQLLSVIPRSYPGHSILTEDLGETGGVDDCACGRKGRHFRVHGRMKSAEVRGCSDTYTG
jgi:hypothetical protein